MHGCDWLLFIPITVKKDTNYTLSKERCYPLEDYSPVSSPGLRLIKLIPPAAQAMSIHKNDFNVGNTWLHSDSPFLQARLPNLSTNHDFRPSERRQFQRGRGR